MADVIGPELRLETVDGVCQRSRRDAGMVDQRVQRAALRQEIVYERRDRCERCEIERCELDRFAVSFLAQRGDGRFCFCAISCDETTRAPAVSSARTVSTPIPNAPPVTIASRPRKS
jgi:hypothetical protein